MSDGVLQCLHCLSCIFVLSQVNERRNVAVNGIHNTSYVGHNYGYDTFPISMCC